MVVLPATAAPPATTAAPVPATRRPALPAPSSPRKFCVRPLETASEQKLNDFWNTVRSAGGGITSAPYGRGVDEHAASSEIADTNETKVRALVPTMRLPRGC